MPHPDKPTIEAIQIQIEEALYPHIAIGAMDIEAARFLATHPRQLRKWQEDGEYLRRLGADEQTA